MSVAICNQRTTTPTIQLFVLQLTGSISSAFLVVVVVVDFIVSLATGDDYMSRGNGRSRTEYSHQKNEALALYLSEISWTINRGNREPGRHLRLYE